jgi:mannose-6-phosphate isomerase-like protein (cupin superfamily)
VEGLFLSVEFNFKLMDKQIVFDHVFTMLQNENIRIASKDMSRPWGGFFVIEEEDADKFIQVFFPTYRKEDLLIGNKLSPKILIVAPGQRLSWQYHFRRAEIWRVVEGEVGVVQSPNDEESLVDNFEPGEIIILEKGTRHRLVGLKDWGVLAEIWQHTDPNCPSDEDDIVRLQDDYGR